MPRPGLDSHNAAISPLRTGAYSSALTKWLIPNQLCNVGLRVPASVRRLDDWIVAALTRRRRLDTR